MTTATRTYTLPRALPFWVSVLLVPVIVAAAALGGWWLLLVPFFAWWLLGILDAIVGTSSADADPQTPEAALFWHRLVTLVWPPLQVAVQLGLLWYVQRVADYAMAEKLGLFFGVGILSGTIGIVYAHELIHQRNRIERFLGDLLLASVLYSHFRSEHLLVHHRYVGTPADAVTARYNEGFHRFFPRVLRQSAVSSFRAEAALLARKGRPWWAWSNPFWRYAALQGTFLALALAIGGWGGAALFAFQAFVAIFQLEAINYIEHYGLTRKHLGGGRYERAEARHSWNATHVVSNWLLINLQRHSDHHMRPDRRYPLLQAIPRDKAPSLPGSYALMTPLALIPPLWRRVMNPRVRAWRKTHYPEIEDWAPYNKGLNPSPRA